MRRSLLLLAGVAGVVVALDRWTKLLASSHLPYNQPQPVLGEFVRLTYTRNSGVAFGIGQDTGTKAQGHLHQPVAGHDKPRRLNGITRRL